MEAICDSSTHRTESRCPDLLADPVACRQVSAEESERVQIDSQRVARAMREWIDERQQANAISKAGIAALAAWTKQA
jgi:hypothetical protein